MSAGEADGGLLAAYEQAARILGPLARRNVALGPLTTYRVGGAAALFVEASTRDDLTTVARAVVATGITPLVVGRGSNLLVSDDGHPGLALVLGAPFATISIEAHTARAGGAVSLPVLARRCVAGGLRGMEWAVGVPGSVGGAVRMNAGGHGSDVSRRLGRAEVFDLSRPPAGALVEMVPRDLDFGYRRCSLSPGQVVVGADFDLDYGPRAEGEAALADIVRWRRANQPGGANAGSIFTNPPGDSAGRLIEAAGLKGHRRGSAFISPRHANFFQSEPGGSAADVVALIREARDVVADRFGVVLRTEVQLVGFSNPLGEVQVEDE